MVWLYSGQVELFPGSARALLERSDLRISPFVALELQYLYEVGKIRAEAEQILEDLESRIELSLDESPFTEVVRCATALRWTRDPFDRVIVAQAKLRRARLLTKDRTLHRHYARAAW